MNESSQTTVIADDFIFLEGPRWYNGELWLSDMWDHTIFRVSEDGERTPVIKVPKRPSGLGFLPDGTLIVASMADRVIYKVIDNELQTHADLSASVDADINDTIVDQHGRIYVGNFGYDLFAEAEQKSTKIIVVEPDGSHRFVGDDLIFPNGMVIKENGSELVVAESFAHKLTRFNIENNGDLTKGSTYADLGELTPDGICLDDEDHIWVASFATGDFVRVAPDGNIVQNVKVNGAAVACQLGGADGRTLFCLVFAGDIADISSGKRLARIETIRVDAAAAGSP